METPTTKLTLEDLAFDTFDVPADRDGAVGTVRGYCGSTCSGTTSTLRPSDYCVGDMYDEDAA